MLSPVCVFVVRAPIISTVRPEIFSLNLETSPIDLRGPPDAQSPEARCLCAFREREGGHPQTETRLSMTPSSMVAD